MKGKNKEQNTVASTPGTHPVTWVCTLVLKAGLTARKGVLSPALLSIIHMLYKWPEVENNEQTEHFNIKLCTNKRKMKT